MSSKLIPIGLILLLVMYVIWSLVTIFNYRNQVIEAKHRIYNIADNFELFKQLHLESNGVLNRQALEADPRQIEITEVTRKEAISELKPGQRLYTMFYNEPSDLRKKQLNRYFSSLVLNNYFFIVTQSDGKIIEMFWDKP